MIVASECRGLHYDIAWHAEGRSKLDLLKLLVNEYKFNINEFLIVKCDLDQELFDFVVNHEELDLEYRHVKRYSELSRTSLQNAIIEGKYELALKLMKVGFQLEIVHPDLRGEIGESFTPLGKLLAMKGFD